MDRKILELQKRAKAKKDLYNAFSGFYYRSAESILEQIKPLLQELNLILSFDEELVSVGSEIAVRSKITLDSEEDTQIYHVSSWAIVDVNKKGMDKAQATGAAISYARKYALGGLLLLDDGIDNDTPQATDFSTLVKKCATITELTDMYNNHKNEIEKDAVIKSLFTQRKIEIKKSQKQ